jgi:4'-phosphopantetheinyl transferase
VSDGTGTIVVRTISLDAVGGGWLLGLLDILDADERHRALAFVFERHRRQFVVAHALKRLMISTMTGEPPGSLRFEKTAFGKPWLKPAGRPHFNLSHCDSMVACALSSNLEVGIDIEPLDRVAAPALVDWYCSPAEQHWLLGLPALSRPRGFVRMWTLKESVLKAAGCGLRHPPRELSMTVGPPAVAISDGILGTPDCWHVRQHCVGPGHAVALAWRGPNARVTLESGDMQSLIAEVSS